jgi:hypothetical protein
MDGFDIGMYRYNSTTDDFDLYPVGVYNPLAVQLFKLEKYTWPDGGTTPPSDTRETDNDCPFDDDDVESSEFGIIIANIVIFITLLVFCATTYLIGKRYFPLRVTRLTVREPYSQSDIVLMVTIGVEFAQAITFGPDLNSLDSFIGDLGDMVSVDLDDLVDLKNGLFWTILHIVHVLVVIWAFSYLFIALKLTARMPNSSIISNIRTLIDLILPVLGGLCFLPIISILLDVFLCYETSGDDMDDAFLLKDCY